MEEKDCLKVGQLIDLIMADASEEIQGWFDAFRQNRTDRSEKVWESYQALKATAFVAKFVITGIRDQIMSRLATLPMGSDEFISLKKRGDEFLRHACQRAKEADFDPGLILTPHLKEKPSALHL